MRISSIQIRERSVTIPLCSIRSPTVWIFRRYGSSLKAATRRQVLLVRKSIGELVIDTPCPAIANAVYNATGVRVRELPITPEKVAMGILAREAGEKV